MESDNLKKFNKLPQSFWIASTKTTNYPTLDKDINVDLAIVGGGMVGISTAYQLRNEGMKIAVLEGGHILQNTTGHTTAKITSQHSIIYSKLKKQFGDELAKQYASANEYAIKEIKKIADENNINCDYSAQSSYIYTLEDSYIKQIEDEVEAAKSLGIEASYVEEIPFSFPIKAGVRFDNQAQFHPRKFLLPLAEVIHNHGVEIYEQSRVVEMDENDDDKYILTTTNGHTVTAEKVIIASHYPFYNKQGMYYARIYQMRAYIVAIKAKEKYPGGMYINAETPTRSLRGYDGEEGQLIFVVGESHKAGQGEDTNQHYESLINFANDLFTIEDVPYRWSTQDCMTLDGVPYVGRFTSETSNLYIATGFAKWGMTNSIVSSILLKDLITKGSSQWKEVYNPSRKTVGPSAKEFVKQNVNVAGQLIDGKLDNPQKDINVEPGEGKIVEIDGKRAGAFRDDEGKLHLVNTTCTHMGCEVNWNSAERSWDCPCHGSRFTVDGDVIEGPAVSPLSFDHDVNTIKKVIKENF